RDKLVTGVQTCALPILILLGWLPRSLPGWGLISHHCNNQTISKICLNESLALCLPLEKELVWHLFHARRNFSRLAIRIIRWRDRSEERRVGKECGQRSE